MPKLLISAFIAFLVAVKFSGIATAQVIFIPPVPEIPDPNLPDISMAGWQAGSQVIWFNPYLCRKAGFLMCGFSRAHEYGHIVNNDNLLGTYLW
jgi:hypothetical protein